MSFLMLSFFSRQLSPLSEPKDGIISKNHLRYSAMGDLPSKSLSGSTEPGPGMGRICIQQHANHLSLPSSIRDHGSGLP